MNKDQIDIEYKREVVRQLRSIASSLEGIRILVDYKITQELANSTAPLIEEKET